MASITVRNPKRPTRWYLVAAGGAALALAVALGIGVWQGARDESTSAVTAPAQEIAAAPSGSRASPRAVDMYTVVLVGSPEQAAQITNYRAALAASGAAEQPTSEVLLVVSSEAEFAEAQRLITEAELFSPGNVRVVDLRAP